MKRALRLVHWAIRTGVYERSIAGMRYVPSTAAGSGQYIRSVTTNGPAGAGSQFV